MANVKPGRIKSGLPAVLEAKRVLSGLTQEELGLRLGLGDTLASAGTFYSKVKHRTSRFPAQKYLRLAGFLKKPVTEVIRQYPPEKPRTISVRPKEGASVPEVIALL